MIRQIWKVRNTSGDPAQKTSHATEETSEAAAATHNDESTREKVEPTAADAAAAGEADGAPKDTDDP